ncbi:F-box protein CPR1 isoform X1 [Rosa chinensis]|nr:F-box protein CPR1 isoform X1 [Rosa chinensis]
MADYIPEHLMVQILQRLPVKSLIRFTSVSKRWRLIILSDPNFAKSQFQQSRSRRVLCLDRKESEFDSRDMEMPWSTGESSTDRKLSCPFKQPGYNLNALFSCNGLVCAALSDRNWTDLDIYLWNPSTQFFKKLPGAPLRFPFTRCYGFGYLSATGDYRVLIGNFCTLNNNHHIFSSNTNSWKSIQSPLPVQRDDQWILSNEALHSVEKEILAFDLNHDKFQTMPLPDPEPGQYIRELGDFRGCLCAFDYKNQCIGFIDLWVMKEYNVGESWTKFFTLKIFDLQPMVVLYLRPIMVMETSTILEIELSNDRRLIDTEFKLIKSCHKEEKFETHEISRKMYAKMIGYEESLLWLGVHNNRNWPMELAKKAMNASEAEKNGEQGGMKDNVDNQGSNPVNVCVQNHGSSSVHVQQQTKQMIAKEQVSHSCK